MNLPNMNSSRISIHPAQPGDYKRLAYLESSAFGDDEFTRLAFGPHREDNDVLEARAKEMREPMNPGEIEKLVKAVRIDVDGREEIVGFAQWRTVHVSEGGVGFYAVAEEEGEQGKRKEEEVELKKDEDGSEGKNVATVVNEKLCNDLFIPGDAYMAKVCNGRDYQSELVNLPVHCQLHDMLNFVRTFSIRRLAGLSKAGYWNTLIESWT